MAAGVVAAFHVGKVPPALPSIRADLGATLRESGWLLSVVNLITAVGGMAIAFAADRLGHRLLMLFGAAVCFVASLMGAFAVDVGQLLAGRLFEGLGFIATTAAVPSLLIRLAREADVRRVMSLWTIYMPAGAGTMMLGAAVILPYASWRMVWLVAAAASGMMLIALLWRTASRKELGQPIIASRPRIGDAMAVLTSAGPLAIAFCFGAYSSCWFTIVGFLPTLQIERLGLSTSTAAIVTAIVTFVNVGGNLAAGTLLGRGARRGQLIVAAAIPMALCAAGIFIDGVPDELRLFLAGLYSLVIGVVPGALFTAIPVHAPRPQLMGAATGLLMQGSNTGALLGPPAAAMLVAWGGWPAAAWLTTAALAVVAATGIFLQRRERRKLSL